MAGNSSPTFDLSLLDPNVASQMAEVNKRKMLAQMLLQNSQQPQGTQAINGVAIAQSPLGNIAAALNQGLGAYQTSQATEGEVALNQLRANALNNFTNGMIGGGSSQPTAPQQATGSVTNSATSPTERTVYAAPLDAGTSADDAQADITGYREQQAAQQQPQQAAQSQGMTGSKFSPDAQKYLRVLMMQDPAKAMEIALTNSLPTTEQRDANFATGGDAAQAANIMRANLIAKGMQNVPEGGTLVNAATGMPSFNAQKGGQYIDYRSGRPVAMPVQNAAAIERIMTGAREAGKADNSLTETFNPMTNAMEKNTISNVVNQVNGGGMGAGGGNAGSGGVQAGASLGTSEFVRTQSEAAGKRVNETVQMAMDSPARQNVLQNISEYADKVTTGTGRDALNKLKGIPELQGLLGNPSDYQTLSKFLQQNAIRNWQAAGGSGTDTQLNAALNASPNTTQTPETIKHLAQYAIAGEKALVGKANAMQNFMADPRNNTQQAQAQFEAQWRNTIDPRVYQMQLMQPEERAQFIQKMSPAEAKTFGQKYLALKQMGGL